jgi:hypothetical protein
MPLIGCSLKKLNDMKCFLTILYYFKIFFKYLFAISATAFLACVVSILCFFFSVWSDFLVYVFFSKMTAELLFIIYGSLVLLTLVVNIVFLKEKSFLLKLVLVLFVAFFITSSFFIAISSQQ